MACGHLDARCVYCRIRLVEAMLDDSASLESVCFAPGSSLVVDENAVTTLAFNDKALTEIRERAQQRISFSEREPRRDKTYELRRSEKVPEHVGEPQKGFQDKSRAPRRLV